MDPSHRDLYWFELRATVTAPFYSQGIRGLKSSEVVESHSLKPLRGKSILIHLNKVRRGRCVDGMPHGQPPYQSKHRGQLSDIATQVKG